MQISIKDLWKLVDTCQKYDDQIILMGDYNQDVRDETFLEVFKARTLKSGIIKRHGNFGSRIYQRGTV